MNIQRGGDVQEQAERQVHAVLAPLQTADDAGAHRDTLCQFRLREISHLAVISDLAADLPQQ